VENLEQREFPLLDRDFATIATLVRERAGIVLGERKRDLVYGRLSRRLRVLRCASFADYCRRLEGPDGEDERRVMLNAITTNLTHFFREPHHFEHLSRQALPAIMRSRPTGDRRVRIWSAGCSSGEEPYSIAISVREVLGDAAGWDMKILATDIDTEMIARAKAGRYDADRIAAVPPAIRPRYACPVSGGGFEMADSLKSLIVFNPLNLLDAWPMQRPFDVIFCRNVVIYFDAPTQRALIERFFQILVPGGWLYVGHSETLFRVSTHFHHLGRTIYRRVG
jgi:chemotaxis protein methyltransferase CheR